MRVVPVVFVVARPGDPDLHETVAAIRDNRTDLKLVVVDATAGGEAALTGIDVGADRVVQVPEGTPFGAGADAGLAALGTADPAVWMWLLPASCLPDPGALDRLLAEIDRFPSVRVAGPKVLGADADGRPCLRSVGLTMTTGGARVEVGAGQHDQAQFDRRSDTLSVARAGMLVRRDLWTRLGGFDPALDGIDDDLDFGVRARLGGDRIVVVPEARVRDRSEAVPIAAPDRERARFLRQLAYPALGTSSPLLLRMGSLGRYPLEVLGDRRGANAALHGAWSAAGQRGLGDRRRELRAITSEPWSVVRPFLVSAAAAGRLAGGRDLELSAEDLSTLPEEPGFWHSRAPVFLLLMLLVSVFMWWRFLGAAGMTGGATAPLPGTIGEVWRSALAGGSAADPFAVLVAVLASVTFWNPGLALGVLVVTAMPLAFAAGWSATRRLTPQGWVRILGGIAWAVAPPFLSSLSAGQLGAAIAHIALGYGLGFALDALARDAPAPARAGLRTGLALALVWVCSPVAGVLALILLVAFALFRPRRSGVLALALVPLTIALAPLGVAAVLRRGWWGLIADPGIPAPGGSSGLLPTALGLPDAATATVWLLPAWTAPLAGAATAGLVLLALAAAGCRRWAAGLAAVVVFALGTLGALALSGLRVVPNWDVMQAPWGGGVLSIAYLGALTGAALALTQLGGARLLAAGLSLLLGVTGAVFFLLAFTGRTALHPVVGVQSPAIVQANAHVHAGARTLEVRALPDGSYGSQLLPGAGRTLTGANRLTASSVGAGAGDLPRLVADLVSSSKAQTAGELRDHDVAFVLLPAGGGGARKAALSALNANATLEPVGETGFGTLWQVRDPSAGAETPLGMWFWINLLQLLVIAVLVIAVLPRPRQRRGRDIGLTQPSGGDPDVIGRQ